MLISGLALAAVAAPAPASAGGAQVRVIGGTNAADTQFPYQARLRIVRGSSVYLCGAVIRDATHVMTAAHCVVSSGTVSSPSSVTVFYGSATQSSQRAAAVGVVEPAAKYVSGDGSYDAALLTLNAPLVGYGGSTVQGAPLATASETAAAVNAGRTATVSGWGITESGNTSATLRSTSVTLRPDSVCSNFYGPGTFVSSRFVCAGGTGTASSGNPDSCNGDSGGPLTTTVGSTVKLVGLVSFGSIDGCGRANTPAGYTEVSNAAIGTVLGAQTTAPAPVTPKPVPPATPKPVPVPVTPAKPATPAPAAALPQPPSAGFAGLVCSKRRCVMRVTSKGGARVTAKLTRKSKRCYLTGPDRFCRTAYVVARTKLTTGRSGEAYVLTTSRLKPATYRLTAVAHSSSGTRSNPLVRQFRIRR